MYRIVRHTAAVGPRPDASLDAVGIAISAMSTAANNSVQVHVPAFMTYAGHDHWPKGTITFRVICMFDLFDSETKLNIHHVTIGRYTFRSEHEVTESSIVNCRRKLFEESCHN